MKITVFIDVQNDFIDGSLGVDRDHKISEKILGYAKRCKENGVATIATLDTHDADLYSNTLEGKKLPVPHCLVGTDGRNLYPGLERLVDKTISKETFASFDIPSLIESICDNVEVDEIELCGFCTSICVISNALVLRGEFPNKRISIVENLCGDINEESHKAALTVAQNCQIDIKSV